MNQNIKYTVNFDIDMDDHINIYIDIKHICMDKGIEFKDIKNIKAKITSVRFINNTDDVSVDYDMIKLGSDEYIYLEKIFKVNDVAIGVCITTEYYLYAYEVYDNSRNIKSVDVSVDIEFE